ncbi:F0F1 ATP synthase subunit epsilon, partial [Staphylococcus epidermidis]
MHSLKLNFVTPNCSVYEREDVELAVLQTTAGEMWIMYGHIPPVAALKTGHVKVNFHNGHEFIAVSDGFIEERQHQLTIIVQTAEPDSEIDVERAKLAKSRAETNLKNDDENNKENRQNRTSERANNRLRGSKIQKLKKVQEKL